ncbi:hypothetical protein Hanom_Chr07g00625481 [Helianthus anomalus]
MKILPGKYNMCIHTLQRTTSTNQTSRLLTIKSIKSSPVPLFPSRSAGQDDRSRNRCRCR